MKELNKQYDALQNIYGDQSLQCIYGGGCIKDPLICFVFMNPTAKNIAANKEWKGMRTQWLGTKEIWKFLNKLGLFDVRLLQQVLNKKPQQWTEAFCEEVYHEVAKNSLYITNLAKCSQPDARHLPDGVYTAYLPLLLQEIQKVSPKYVFLFGNQVASLVLQQKISVSQSRQKRYILRVDSKSFPTYAVYYPVGNGRFNQHKAIEDITAILRGETRI